MSGLELLKRFDEIFLIKTILHQIANFFLFSIDENIIKKNIHLALNRFAFCVNQINLKYFHKDGFPYFNQYHGDHYAMFLYLLSRVSYENDDEQLAEVVFLLNKYLHGIDAFYKVKLPEVFLFVHPHGTIIGNAEFGNYIVFYQNVSIGSKAEGIYPKFSDYTLFYSKSSVIGNCNCGENVVFGANSCVIDKNIDSNQIVTGSIPDLKTRKLEYNFLKENIFK